MSPAADPPPAAEPSPISTPPAVDSLVASKSPEGVRRMFSDIAPTYDLLNHLLSGGIDIWWRRLAARQLITPDTRCILDVCAGTGDLTQALALQAWRLDLPVTLVATDFTPAMTCLARDKFARAAETAAGSPALELPAHPAVGVADTLRLPFADSTFDLVTVAFGIRNVADLEQGLRELTRVVRPGGTIGILEFSSPRLPPFRQLYNFYFHHLLPRIGRLISGTRAYLYLPRSVSRFPDTPEFASLLSTITSTPCTARRLTFGVATLYVATKGESVER